VIELDEDDVRCARASASPVGWLTNSAGFWVTLVALTMATMPLVMMLPDAIGRFLLIVGYRGALPVYAVFLWPPLWFLPRMHSARAWTRELRWVNALPFVVENYACAIGKGFRNQGDCHMYMEFADDAPDEATLHQFLDMKGGTWRFTVQYRRGVTLMRSPNLVNQRQSRNRRLFVWFHAFVEDRLLPLHEAHPVTSFRFNDRQWS
jgi:hypothetical protein